MAEVVGDQFDERLADEARLARAGDAGDAGEGAEGECRVDAGEVVAGDAGEAEPVRYGKPTHGRGWGAAYGLRPTHGRGWAFKEIPFRHRLLHPLQPLRRAAVEDA